MIWSIWPWLLGLAGFAAQQYPPAFPREGATKVLENERVIVWDVTWARGKPTPMHRHRYDVVGVILVPGSVKITLPDGSSRLSEEGSRGSVVSADKGVTHMEEGMSDTSQRAVIIEIKDVSPPAIERPSGIPPAFPREGVRRVLDHPRVAVWDYTFTPGRPIPFHFHERDAVVVVLDPGRLRSHPESGKPEEITWMANAVRWGPRGRAHREEVLEGSPRAIIIELK